MHKLTIAIVLLLITGCGSSPIKYQASLMDINDAKNILEELTWTQHSNWRPDSFVITERYIAWGFGSTSKSTGFATTIGNTGIAVGSASSETRNVGDRYYYRSIQKIGLISWKRKLKQWYVVSIIDKNNRRKHILRTRNLDDAKLFTDAMTTIVNVYGKMKVNDNASKSKGVSH